MEFKILSGTDEQVYSIIGKFAMNRKYIAELGNAITTNEKTKWYLLYNENSLVGFCAVENSTIKNLIGISIERDTFTKLLIEELKKSSAKIEKLSIYVKNTELDKFKDAGFSERIKRVNWITMDIKLGDLK